MKAFPKLLSRLFSLFAVYLFMFPSGLNAQIDNYWIDTTTHPQSNNALFFTNRPVKLNSKGGEFEFKNKSTKQTDNLFFCLFDYEHDSMLIKYRAHNTSDAYPTEKVENNIFYKIYDDLRIKKGIKKISFVVPGFSHTFKSQVNGFMQRTKAVYSDSTHGKAAIVLYAWGNEWRPHRYFRGRRSAKRGANDFAIFQHMLEDFLADSAFFSTHPNDLSIYLTCTSMGNQLLKEYLLERERQDIPLAKVYRDIYFIGSDASWNSFEPEKGFHNMGEMCDTVRVVWHEKDFALKVSKVINFRKRMGLNGPKDPEKLPGYIKSYDVEYLLTDGDKSGVYHGYALSNPEFQRLILEDLRAED